MTTLIYPAPEATAVDWDNIPVNIELVRGVRRMRLTGSDIPAIQFFFTGPGSSVEWAFLTDADRDTAWTHILTAWGEPIG